MPGCAWRSLGSASRASLEGCTRGTRPILRDAASRLRSDDAVALRLRSYGPVPQRGGSRSSRTRGGMRWTLMAPADERRQRGRRSRVGAPRSSSPIGATARLPRPAPRQRRADQRAVGAFGQCRRPVEPEPRQAFAGRRHRDGASSPATTIPRRRCGARSASCRISNAGSSRCSTSVKSLPNGNDGSKPASRAGFSAFAIRSG